MLLVLNGYLNHGPTTLSSTKENNGGIASPLVNDEMKSLMEGLMHDLTELSVDEENLKNGRILHMLIEPPVDYESEIIDNEEPICNSLENGNNENDEEGIVTIHPKALSLLQAIEKLLPDPVEDEENHKGAWDLVMDLNGRESVRIREEKLYRIGNGGLRANGTASDGGVEVVCRESLQWRTVSAVTRVLIYYDFLTKGVLEMGAFE